MKRAMWQLMAVLAGAALWAGNTALAEDSFPPCWRGQANSTLQNWRFDANANPASPEAFSNTNSPAPSATIVPTISGTGWTDDELGLGTKRGVWDAQSVSLAIPNAAGSAASWKYVWVQVTEWRGPFYTAATVSVSGATPVGSVESVNVERVPTDPMLPTFGNWSVQKSLWRIAPCPADETVTITGGQFGSLIDQVIVDTLCVDITCPADVTVSNDPDQCGRTGVVVPGLAAPDGCIIASVNCAPALAGSFPVGSTPVACTITDTAGQIRNCGFNVVVVDSQPPAPVCPADITVPGVPGNCGVNVTWSAAATDNCAGATISCLPPSGSFFRLGVTVVTCVARDAANNTAPCSFNVTVTGNPGTSGDAFPPCWRNGPGLNTTFQTWRFDDADQTAIAPETVNNANGGPTAEILIGPFGDGWNDTLPGFGCRQGMWELGQSGAIILTVPNAAGSPVSYKYLHVQITQWQDGGLYSDLATVAGGILVSRETNTVETVPFGSWVTEKWVLSITPCPASETITITGGEFGSLIDQVVVDTLCTEPPICPTDITVDQDAGQCSASSVAWTLPAVDNCTIRAVSCTTNGVAVANPGAFPIGQTVVSCVFADSENQTTTCAFLVTVRDVEPPVIVSCAPAAILPADASCLAPVPDFRSGVIATDCSAFTVTQSPLAGTPVGLGPHSIMLTVTDVAGHSAACATLFTVMDTTPPVITTCAPPQSADADATCQAAVPNFTGGVVATDCNGPLTVTQSPTVGTLVGVGPTTVTLTVRDAANNPATCTTTFTVRSLADLSVQVVSSPDPVTVGQPVSYTVTVENLGPCPASGVTVNNVLSAGQVLVSVTDPGTSLARACPTPGPSAWYRAEGNASDSVGANHGTLNGGVTFGPQAVAQGFIFDGVNDYVSVPDDPALQPTSLTIEGWIKIGDPNGLHVVLAKPQGGALADSYSVWIASGVLHAAVSDAAGSGPFLTYPNFPTSSIFLFSDITDFPPLANKLKTPAPADFVSQYLKSQLSADTLVLLAAYAGGPDTPLQRHIVADFNRIIQNGPLYTVPRFLGVTLSDETLYVLGRNPTGIDLVRLNRLLIRDTYPAEIATILFPQLTQRYHIAYTFDQGTGKQALYVNGDLVDSSFVAKTITYTSRPLVIGAGENALSATDYFFQGELDELALYNRALSGIEVQGIHSAGANGKCFNSGAVALGSLAGGASQTFTVVGVPTTCPTASLQATVSGTETDPILANNTATATATVAELPASLLSLSIRRVSPNNDHVEISWPITCAPFILETTADLSPPIILWTPATVPVQILQGRYSTVVPASDPHHFFRLKSP